MKVVVDDGLGGVRGRGKQSKDALLWDYSISGGLDRYFWVSPDSGRKTLFSDGVQESLESVWKALMAEDAPKVMEGLEDLTRNRGLIASVPTIRGFSGLTADAVDDQILLVHGFLNTDVLHLISKSGFASREVVRANASLRRVDDYDVRDPWTIPFEMANNIMLHAREGVVFGRSVEVDSRVGLEFTAVDRGPGLADVPWALRRGTSDKPEKGENQHGLGGKGASNIWLNSDELEIKTFAGRGSLWRAVKWRPKL